MRRDHRERGGKPFGKINISVQLFWEDETVKTTQSFVTVPAVTRSPDRFFLTPDGALTQRSPQETMPLKGDAG